MDSIQPKKMLIINILEILKKHSDAKHGLSQKEIAYYLEKDYEMKADRKAIKRNLMNLAEFEGYTIEYDSETKRTVRNYKTGELEEEDLLTDFRFIHDFDDSELRLLIDSLLFSKHIPYSQCKDLIEKIEKLSSERFKSKMRHVCNMPENLPQNKELFYTIEMLDEAISTGRQVSFKYNRYGTDKKLHPRQSSSGEDRVYIVNPYQMVATNGRYYLVCNYDKYDNIANYRVDMITDIKVLDSPVKPKKQVRGLEAGLDLPKHMAEHIYMFSDETVRVKFIAKKYIVGEIIDWFGKDVKFSNETEDEVTAEVRVSAMAMKFWALQYAPHITVTEPKTLRDEIGTELRKAAERYGK